MSRIGRKPIAIPSGVKVELKDQNIKITGPVGSMLFSCHPYIKLKVDTAAGIIVVENEHPENTEYKQLHGTMRALISNMITGVTKGFEKKLEIVGIGYRAEMQGNNVVFYLGYSHPIAFQLPEGITAQIEKQTLVTVKGINKELLGEVAAKMRALRKPDPYKNKGVKYAGEVLRKKAGKSGK
jgi:large subunit ribosomal protein L6